METLERVQVLRQRVVATGRGRVVVHGSVRKRVPSETARRAADAFTELRRFFRTSTQLQKALHWSAPTLRSWIVEEGPVRPRIHSVERVFLLLDVAKAAQRWVSDPYLVGDWLLEPNESLGNASPIQVIDVLDKEGAHGLIENMAAIAPRERVSADDFHLDADALRETLKQLGAPPIADMHGSGEVDLSDFD